MRPEDHFRLLLDDGMIEREGQLRWPQTHPGGLLTIWVLCPLGARVELLATSANARVCVGAGSDRPVSCRTVRRARPELAAEYIARASQSERLLQLLARRPEARRHIVTINPGADLPALEAARHYVRVIEGRIACEGAVHSMVCADVSSVDSRK